MSGPVPINDPSTAQNGLDPFLKYSIVATGIAWLFVNDLLPDFILSRLPDSGWFGIGLALILYAPALYHFEWASVRCHTALGKALLYVNFPLSSTLFVLAMPELLPTFIQQRLNPHVPWVWELLSLCIGLPLAFWWEERWQRRHGSTRGLGQQDESKT